MKPEQKELVTKTWNLIVPISDQAALLFYNQLFAIDPATRAMFRETDLADQRKKLMQVLSIAVQSLDRLDELIPIVEALGQRHASYGVQDKHYDTVGIALLQTLEQGLGPAWTTEVSEAWEAAYTMLSGVMRDAAKLTQKSIVAA